MPSEFDLIARHFTRPPRHAVLGVGDDAALLAPVPGHELAVTTDMLVDGVHFFPDVDPRSLGHKALAVNLSDLAAMGARPRYVLLALALPTADEAWLSDFAAGFLHLADENDVDLVGGDTTRGPLTICVHAIGDVARGSALRRDGACAGDDIWVSGTLGDAAAAVAHRKGVLQLDDATLAHCMARLDRPLPRVMLGRALSGIASAAVDVSDGLAADLGHICERSGVAARLDLDSLPCSAELEPLRHHEAVTRCILAGGDDYELCFCAAPTHRAYLSAVSRRMELRLTRIGQVGEGRGVSVRDAGGHELQLQDVGFDHFR